MTTDEIRKVLHDVLFDISIVRHGFTPYFRDYDVVGAVFKRQCLFRFTHCVAATVTTAVPAASWRQSWDDVYTDYSAWERAGYPEGYVWGVCYLSAYPGPEYVESSDLAQYWAGLLGEPMHEVEIETNGHNIVLVFHDLIVRDLNPNDVEWVK